ncbi:MAG TPA: methionine biosynthesis protein MetW [Candidatus Acidoferrum sp.]|nr:methionine biosynthesis protein MetW [Candidatus Acidoferrum sp.]
MKNGRPDLQVITQMVPEGARVLDLGCGDGVLLSQLVERRGIAGRGVEVAEAKVRACIARGLSVRHGNIEEGLADFPDGMFDVVILSQTLAYLNRPLAVLQEMARVGRLAIVSLENAGHWRARWRALSGKGAGTTLVSREPRVRSITLPQFQDSLQELKLTADGHVFLRSDSRVRIWPSIRAETAVYVITKL